jgi:hypothetical protein
MAGEEVLGQSGPTVFQDNIMPVLLDRVQVWRNNQYGILPQNRTII